MVRWVRMMAGGGEEGGDGGYTPSCSVGFSETDSSKLKIDLPRDFSGEGRAVCSGGLEVNSGKGVFVFSALRMLVSVKNVEAPKISLSTLVSS